MKLWEKYRGMPIQAKASVWYTFCNFLQNGIAFLVIPVYTRILSTDEYGDWSVFQSWMGILLIFASLNLYCGVYTKTLVDMPDKKERDRYTSSVLALGTLSTLALLGIYLLLKTPADRLLQYDGRTMTLLFVYFAVYPALNFWSTRQYVEYKYKPLIAVTLLLSVLAPAVSIFLLYNTELRVKAIIQGYLCVNIAFGAFFYIMEMAKGRVLFHRQYWSYALKFNIPLIPHYLSLIVLGQSDRIMIKHYCGESDAGIYSLAYSVANAMNVLMAAVNGSRVPWTYSQLRKRQYGQLRKISSLLCVMMGLVTLGVTLLAPEVVKIMGTEQYRQAVHVIPVVALGVYFTFVYDLFCGVEFYYGATKYVMYASLSGAALNVVLNALLIPAFGFTAAGYTTLFCYLVFMLMHLVFMRRVCRREGITESVYDLRTVFLISAAAAGIVFAAMATYRNDLVRYIFLALLAGFCVLQRRRILEIWQRIKNPGGGDAA